MAARPSGLPGLRASAGLHAPYYQARYGGDDGRFLSDNGASPRRISTLWQQFCVSSRAFFGSA